MLLYLGIWTAGVGADLNPTQRLLLGFFLFLLGGVIVGGGGGVIGAIIFLCGITWMVLCLVDWSFTILVRRGMAKGVEEQVRLVPARPRLKPARRPRSPRDAEPLRVIEPSDLICQHCGFVNPQGHRYCGSCGYPLIPEGTRVY